MTGTDNTPTPDGSPERRPAETQRPAGIEPDRIDGNLTELSGDLERVPQLSELRASTVQTILSAIAGKDPIQLPPSTKIEMEEAGLIESKSESAYAVLQSEITALPSVTQERDAQQESVDGLQTRSDQLTKKLTSGWHRFWSRSATLKREQGDTDVITESLTQERDVLATLEDRFSKLTPKSEQFSSFVRTSEGYVSISAAGTEWLNHSKGFVGVAPSSSYLEISASLDACARSFGCYQQIRSSSDLYSYNHLGPLVPVAIFSRSNPQAIMEDYALFRSADGLCDYDHIPGLTASKTFFQKSVEEVMALYLAFKSEDGLIHTDHIPSLVSTSLMQDIPVDKLMVIYKEFRDHPTFTHRASSKLYDCTHIPALVAVAARFDLTAEQVMERYREFGAAPSLIDHAHLPSLVATSFQAKKPVDEIMGIYEEFRDHPTFTKSAPSTGSTLYDCTHIAALVSLAVRTGKSTGEIMAYYELIKNSSMLYTYAHIPPLVATSLGVVSMNALTAADEDSGYESSRVHDSSTGQDSMFDSGLAVMGDVIDNGSLDFSGGFVAGGIIGGMLD